MDDLNKYIEYYGTKTFEENPLNDIDNIIFTTLAYLPIKSNFKESKNIKQLINIINEENKVGPLPKKSVRLIKQIELTTRYKDILFKDYVSILDEKTQFCALTIEFQTNNIFIVFKGTDNSLTGWKEDFQLLYEYPTTAQKLAAEYLNKHMDKETEKIYIAGHSKGGNLAMASAMETNKEVFRKIQTIYNNDGPGFLEKQHNSKKFTKIKPKLKNIIPEESMIGVLLENENYQIVTSSAHSIMQHDLTTWKCFGEFLLKGNMSNISIKTKTKLKEYLITTTKEKRKNITEEFFSLLSESGITYFRELKNLKPSELSDLISKIKNVDEQSKEMIMMTASIFLGLNKKDKSE